MVYPAISANIPLKIEASGGGRGSPLGSYKKCKNALSENIKKMILI